MEIRINKPCSENWDTMKMGEGCRFCVSCQKNVIDFTRKSRDEIEELFLLKKDERTCGRFTREQLEPNYSCAPIIIRPVISQKNEFNTPLWLMAAATSLLLAACENPSIKPATEKVIKTEISSTDTVKKNKKEPVDTLAEGVEVMPQTLPVDPPPRLPCTSPPIDPDVSIAMDGMIVGDFTVDPNAALDFAEVMPQFKGGDDSLKNHILKDLVYPAWEKENGIEGRVIARFVVDKTGKLRDFEIIKSVNGSRNFDAEVLRVLKNMPDFIPGSQYGVPVAVKYILPVTFKLASDARN